MYVLSDAELGCRDHIIMSGKNKLFNVFISISHCIIIYKSFFTLSNTFMEKLMIIGKFYLCKYSNENTFRSLFYPTKL